MKVRTDSRKGIKWEEVIMAKSKSKTITIHRSSITGRFVSANDVKKHPNTTQTEHRKRK